MKARFFFISVVAVTVMVVAALSSGGCYVHTKKDGGRVKLQKPFDYGKSVQTMNMLANRIAEIQRRGSESSKKKIRDKTHPLVRNLLNEAKRNQQQSQEIIRTALVLDHGIKPYDVWEEKEPSTIYARHNDFLIQVHTPLYAGRSLLRMANEKKINENIHYSFSAGQEGSEKIALVNRICTDANSTEEFHNAQRTYDYRHAWIFGTPAERAGKIMHVADMHIDEVIGIHKEQLSGKQGPAEPAAAGETDREAAGEPEKMKKIIIESQAQREDARRMMQQRQ